MLAKQAYSHHDHLCSEPNKGFFLKVYGHGEPVSPIQLPSPVTSIVDHSLDLLVMEYRFLESE
jgi:hypothetical protein